MSGDTETALINPASRTSSCASSFDILSPSAINPSIPSHFGARVDPVAAYDGGNGRDELARLGALLAGGGIDALIFSDVREVHSFIDLYDAQDLPRLLAGTAVFCLGERVAAAAAESGLNVALIPSARPVSALLRALFSHSSG